MPNSSTAVDLSHVVIRASAGTGKTFQLTNRFLKLLLTGVAPDQVLATTFTRKAAGEIQDRVIVRLAEAALGRSEREGLASAIGFPRLSEEQCRGTLHQVLRNLHRLRIGTLDSFFGQLSRAFSTEIGLPPSWRVVDPVEEATLRDAAIRGVLGREQTADLVSLTQLLTQGEASRGVSELVRATVDSLHELYLDACDDAWEQIPQPKPLDDMELQTALGRLRDLTVKSKSLTVPAPRTSSGLNGETGSVLLRKGSPRSCWRERRLTCASRSRTSCARAPSAAGAGSRPAPQPDRLTDAGATNCCESTTSIRSLRTRQRRCDLAT